LSDVTPLSALAASGHTRTCVLVLGMHRSGTSALARVLNLLGLPIGQPLMPPHPDNNEAGFWELAGAVEINERILERISVPWDSPVPLPSSWLEQIPREVFEEGVALIDGNFSAVSAFALKDPRMCRLWPFWLQVMSRVGFRTIGAHLLRPPAEVTASLVARDGLSTERCAALWARHTLEAEAIPVERTLLRYDDLLALPRRTVDSVLGWLLQQGVALGNPPIGEIEAFLQPALRHHRALPRMRGAVGALAEQLYDSLVQAGEASSRTNALVVDRAGKIQSKLDRWVATRPVRAAALVAAPIEAITTQGRDPSVQCDDVPAPATPDPAPATSGPSAPSPPPDAGPVAAGLQAQRIRIADILRAGCLWLGIWAPPIRLTADHQLHADRDVFEATGIDPWFKLDATPPLPWGWPAGWYAVTLRGIAASPLLEPKLYVDDGTGFSEESAVMLPLETTLGARGFIHVKARMLQLRLDPTHRPARFRLGGIELRRVPAALMAARILGSLLSRTLTASGLTWREARILWRLWLAEGLPGIARMLVRDIDVEGRDYGWKPIPQRVVPRGQPSSTSS
jgi:hypothetical protein